MTIPENFELAPVKAGTHPPPAPPECQKQQLYSNGDVEAQLAAIDTHAIEEAKITYTNFRDLIWNLVFKNNFSDLEKARLLFRWMTCKDLASLEFDSENPTVPEKLLAAFKTGSGSYARTFEYLARYSGLHCVAISGWAKGAEYRPGDRLTSGPPNHSWNAVFIDNSWYLIDCHWASRYMRTDGDSSASSSSDSDSYKYNYECDDFYFLTDPHTFIYSHLPTDSKWQLLENRWSNDDFEQRAYIKSQFFTLGLQVMPENSSVVYAEDGMATLSLTFGVKAAFTYRFRHENGLDETKNMNRFVLQEMTDQHLTYFIRTPVIGSYILTVFAREFLDEVTPKSMITFKSVAEYKIINEAVESSEETPPFPYCSDSSWGLDMYASFSGRRLHPNYRMAVLLCPNGHGEITIARQDPLLRLYARLVKEGIAFDKLKSCVVIETSDGLFTVSVNLPEEGEYGLEVFVNHPQKDGKLYSHFCQYLCTTETDGKFADIYMKTHDSLESDRSVDGDSSNKGSPEISEAIEEAVEAVSAESVCASKETVIENDEISKTHEDHQLDAVSEQKVSEDDIEAHEQDPVVENKHEENLAEPPEIVSGLTDDKQEQLTSADEAVEVHDSQGKLEDPLEVGEAEAEVITEHEEPTDHSGVPTSEIDELGRLPEDSVNEMCEEGAAENQEALSLDETAEVTTEGPKDTQDDETPAENEGVLQTADDQEEEASAEPVVEKEIQDAKAETEEALPVIEVAEETTDAPEGADSEGTPAETGEDQGTTDEQEKEASAELGEEGEQTEAVEEDTHIQTEVARQEPAATKSAESEDTPVEAGDVQGASDEQEGEVTAERVEEDCRDVEAEVQEAVPTDEVAEEEAGTAEDVDSEETQDKTEEVQGASDEQDGEVSVEPVEEEELQKAEAETEEALPTAEEAHETADAKEAVDSAETPVESGDVQGASDEQQGEVPAEEAEIGDSYELTLEDKVAVSTDEVAEEEAGTAEDVDSEETQDKTEEVQGATDEQDDEVSVEQAEEEKLQKAETETEEALPTAEEAHETADAKEGVESEETQDKIEEVQGASDEQDDEVSVEPVEEEELQKTEAETEEALPTAEEAHETADAKEAVDSAETPVESGDVQGASDEQQGEVPAEEAEIGDSDELKPEAKEAVFTDGVAEEEAGTAEDVDSEETQDKTEEVQGATDEQDGEVSVEPVEEEELQKAEAETEEALPTAEEAHETADAKEGVDSAETTVESGDVQGASDEQEGEVPAEEAETGDSDELKPGAKEAVSTDGAAEEVAGTTEDVESEETQDKIEGVQGASDEQEGEVPAEEAEIGDSYELTLEDQVAVSTDEVAEEEAGTAEDVESEETQDKTEEVQGASDEQDGEVSVEPVEEEELQKAEAETEEALPTAEEAHETADAEEGVESGRTAAESKAVQATADQQSTVAFVEPAEEEKLQESEAETAGAVPIAEEVHETADTTEGMESEETQNITKGVQGATDEQEGEVPAEEAEIGDSDELKPEDKVAMSTDGVAEEEAGTAEDVDSEETQDKTEEVQGASDEQDGEVSVEPVEEEELQKAEAETEEALPTAEEAHETADGEKSVDSEETPVAGIGQDVEAEVQETVPTDGVAEEEAGTAEDVESEETQDKTEEVQGATDEQDGEVSVEPVEEEELQKAEAETEEALPTAEEAHETADAKEGVESEETQDKTEEVQGASDEQEGEVPAEEAEIGDSDELKPEAKEAVPTDEVAEEEAGTAEDVDSEETQDKTEEVQGASDEQDGEVSVEPVEEEELQKAEAETEEALPTAEEAHETADAKEAVDSAETPVESGDVQGASDEQQGEVPAEEAEIGDSDELKPEDKVAMSTDGVAEEEAGTAEDVESEETQDKTEEVQGASDEQDGEVSVEPVEEEELQKAEAETEEALATTEDAHDTADAAEDSESEETPAVQDAVDKHQNEVSVESTEMGENQKTRTESEEAAPTDEAVEHVAEGNEVAVSEDTADKTEGAKGTADEQEEEVAEKPAEGEESRENKAELEEALPTDDVAEEVAEAGEAVKSEDESAGTIEVNSAADELEEAPAEQVEGNDCQGLTDNCQEVPTAKVDADVAAEATDDIDHEKAAVSLELEHGTGEQDPPSTSVEPDKEPSEPVEGDEDIESAADTKEAHIEDEVAEVTAQSKVDVNEEHIHDDTEDVHGSDDQEIHGSSDEQQKETEEIPATEKLPESTADAEEALPTNEVAELSPKVTENVEGEEIPGETEEVSSTADEQEKSSAEPEGEECQEKAAEAEEVQSTDETTEVIAKAKVDVVIKETPIETDEVQDTTDELVSAEPVEKEEECHEKAADTEEALPNDEVAEVLVDATGSVVSEEPAAETEELQDAGEQELSGTTDQQDKESAEQVVEDECQKIVEDIEEAQPIDEPQNEDETSDEVVEESVEVKTRASPAKGDLMDELMSTLTSTEPEFSNASEPTELEAANSFENEAKESDEENTSDHEAPVQDEDKENVVEEQQERLEEVVEEMELAAVKPIESCPEKIDNLMSALESDESQPAADIAEETDVVEVAAEAENEAEAGDDAHDRAVAVEKSAGETALSEQSDLLVELDNVEVSDDQTVSDLIKELETTDDKEPTGTDEQDEEVNLTVVSEDNNVTHEKNTVTSDDDQIESQQAAGDDNQHEIEVDNMFPPDDFELEPIEESLPADAEISLANATKKPFNDVEEFSDLDSHASKVSREPHSSYRNLVWHLIHSHGSIDSDLRKARALFVYLCSKDLSTVTAAAEDVEEESPDKLLVNLQRGLTTYARVFETLCSYVGLHCETVNGYAKGADYRPGMHFEGDDGQHSWNVVLIDDTWRLVDCHWAARRLVGKQVSSENVRYELDEYYFMPDPRQLIFTHFPLDQRWQLLQNAISLDDFEKLVPVKSTFFKQDLQLVSHYNAVIEFDNEQTLIIGCPTPSKDGSHLVFTFTLTSDELGDSHDGIDLSQFGMQYMVDGCESHFTIRPPQPGTYQLVIYAKEQQNTDAPFGGICEYQLVCRKSYDKAVPYPPCAHTTWGAGDSAALYPLTPLNGSGAIVETADDGIAEIRLQMKTELRFSARFKSVHHRDEEAMSRYVLIRVVGDVLVVLVKVPSVGEYGLEIYANNPATDGQSLRHVYQYMIVCRRLPNGPPKPYPALPSGYLGPQPGFKSLGLALSTALNGDPYVAVNGSNVVLSFTPSLPVRVTSQLINDANEDMTEYVLQQCPSDGTVSFIIRLPRAGIYKLQVYGALYTPEPAESLPGIYNFLIDYAAATEAVRSADVFPRQYASWRDGCYLVEPVNGQLVRTKEPVQFKLIAPLAASVAVVIGAEWIMLDKDKDGTWQGDVPLDQYWSSKTKVSVCAAYESNSDSYSTLLEYTM